MSLTRKIKWLLRRIIKMYFYRIAARDEYGARMKRSKQDQKFLKDTDPELTEEQKKEIDDFWSKYRFAYKPNYNTFRAYYNRSGISDPRYLPHGLRNKTFIQEFWANSSYMYAIQDKAWLDKIYTSIKQPESVIRKMSEMFYDNQFNQIEKDEAVRICEEYILNGEELIFKPSGQKGGLGIEVIGKDRVEEIDYLLSTMRSPTVVQKLIKQHPDLKKLNEDSVNSLRLTTLMYDGEFTPLAAFVKVGKSGNRVDNFFAGGVVVGIDIETGEFYKWALTKKNNKRKTLANGLSLSKNKLVFPEYKKVVEAIRRAHLEIPMIKVVSWDVTVDENGEPVLIEPNLGGDLRVNQALTGPILGDKTEMLLDDLLLNKFYKEKVSVNYNYREYHDHIAVTRYCGLRSDVKVPEKINDKPVTVIASAAFSKNDKLRKVSLPDTVEYVNPRAFEFCRGMEYIVIPDNVNIDENAVYSCGSCIIK